MCVCAGVGRVWAVTVRVAVAMAPELQLFALMVMGVVVILVVFALWPQIFWCPRQLIKVRAVLAGGRRSACVVLLLWLVE